MTVGQLKNALMKVNDDLEVYRVYTIEEAEFMNKKRKENNLKDVCFLVVPLYNGLEGV